MNSSSSGTVFRLMESTVGISWHGSMIYLAVNKDTLTADEKMRVEDHEILYFDHIQQYGNKQDALCVFSVIEAAIIRLKALKPNVRTISLQSDNASAYQSAEVLVFLWLLSKVYDVEVTRFVHTETQDGKGVIDGHFAIAMMHVLRLVSSGQNAITPAQLVELLRTNGGIMNSFPVLYSMSRGVLGDVQRKHAVLIDAVKAIGRWNEAVFQYGEANGDMLRMFQYSGMDYVEVCLDQIDTSHASEVANQMESANVDYGDGDDNNSVIDEDGFDQNEDDYAEQDIERQTGKISGVIIESDLRITRLRKRWKRRIRDDIEELHADAAASIPDLMCSCCHRMFSSDAFRKLHVCRGPPEKKDVISYCKKRAIDMYQRSMINVVVADEDDPVIYDAFDDVGFVEEFKSGWARRVTGADLYGAKYIEEFIDEAREMYQAGVDNSSQKMCTPILFGIIYSAHVLTC